MATTTYGTPYVQSSDLVSAYPGTSSTLATRVDDVSLVGNGVNAQTASYTLVLTDGGKTITMTNASATTLTVPTNASVAFPTGVGIVAINLGAGTMTVAGAGGVTVSGTSLTVAQFESIVLRKTAANTWVALKGAGFPKASVSSVTGAPSTGTMTDSDGFTWSWWKWTGNGSVVIGTAGYADLLVLGGGGGGMASGAAATSGGGGGGLRYGNFWIPAATYTVTIGGGGGAQTVGSTSSFGTFLRAGGGESGYAVNSLNLGQVRTGGGGAGGGSAAGTYGGSNGAGQGGTVNATYNYEGLTLTYDGTATAYGRGGFSGSTATANLGQGGAWGNSTGSSGVVIMKIRTN